MGGITPSDEDFDALDKLLEAADRLYHELETRTQSAEQEADEDADDRD